MCSRTVLEFLRMAGSVLFIGNSDTATRMSQMSDESESRPDLYTAHFVVSGRVQGVWFRMSTKQQADFHGITGWVRNLPDGRVEGMARGDAASLKNFRSWLGHGPEMARVLKVEWSKTADQEYNGFSVR